MPWSGRSKRAAHRLLGHHLVDREVLADVAQELEGRDGAQPVGVVEQEGAVEIEELAELGPDALQVALDRLEGEQLALVLLAPGVADHAGPAAGQRDGPVPGLLEAPQRAELQQAAHVQAVRARVEAGVDREARLVEPLGQLGVGHLVDQAAEGEVLRERGHAFDSAIRQVGSSAHGTGAGSSLAGQGLVECTRGMHRHPW